MAARCRACIRSRSFWDGCALSRLHSQPLIFGWLRAVALAFAAAHCPVRGERLSRLKNLSPLPGLHFAQNGNHGLQPWLCSDAAPRLPSSHSEFLEDQEF